MSKAGSGSRSLDLQYVCLLIGHEVRGTQRNYRYSKNSMLASRKILPFGDWMDVWWGKSRIQIWILLDVIFS